MKNIESKLTESRSYKPNESFSEDANIKEEDLLDLNNKYKKNPDIFWSKLAKKI